VERRTAVFVTLARDKTSSSWFLVELPRFENSRNVETTVWLALRLVYLGSGIPSWRQILRANRSAISV
jgi:hypothetical protein